MPVWLAPAPSLATTSAGGQSWLVVDVMMVRQAQVPSRSRTDQPPGRGHPGWLTIAMVVQGAAVTVLLGLDGSPGRRAARALVTLAVTALGCWHARRAGRVGWGVTAMVLGIAGTTTGAGVASGQVAYAGVDAVAVLAAIVLAASLVLLVDGVVVLLRVVPGWWRLLAIPVALAAFQFVLMPLTIAVNATNRAAQPLGSATPATYGLSYQNVAFRTTDGVRLSGWYVPPRNGAAVLLLPGAGSSRTAVLAQAAVLARNGYGALLIDTRGHGLSGGHAMDFGWWGARDIGAAVSFLARRPGVSTGKIAVLGESMGGEQALAAVGADPLIRAVIAEGVTGAQLADHGWMPHGIVGFIDRGTEWVQYTAAGLLSGAPYPPSIVDSIRAAAPRPVLIIASGAVTPEATAARWYQSASPATVRVWVVPHAGHMQGLATAPRAWQAHVLGFLRSALGP